MKKYLIILLATCIANLSFSQDNFKKNDIYLEAFGNGIYGSLNYERQLTARPGLGARIGFGFFAANAFYPVIPVGLNYLFQTGNAESFIETGLGATWARLDVGALGSLSGRVVENVSVGYRRHTRHQMMWRTNAILFVNGSSVLPWLGVAFGKRF